MGQSQHQCAGTSGRVIHRHIADIPLHHDPGNDASNGMRGIVLGILAEIFIVVLDQIFENLGKEIILLLKHIGKASP